MELVAAISGSGEMRTYKIATAMITTMTALARDNTIFNHTPGATSLSCGGSTRTARWPFRNCHWSVNIWLKSAA